MVTISTSNSNLDGRGTLGTVLTVANNITLIKSVFIKAQGGKQSGVVRLFIFNGSRSILLHDIYIPENAQDSINKSFEIQLELNITLIAGFMLRASTQQANTFNIIVTETKSALDESFERTLIFEDDLDIQAGYSILVSTQQS